MQIKINVDNKSVIRKPTKIKKAKTHIQIQEEFQCTKRLEGKKTSISTEIKYTTSINIICHQTHL